MSTIEEATIKYPNHLSIVAYQNDSHLKQIKKNKTDYGFNKTLPDPVP